MSHFKKGEEVILTPPCRHGFRTAVRKTANGGTESCLLTAEPTDSCEELVEFKPGSGGRVVVESVIPFTARTRPATNAYRSGWDATFGKSQAN